MMRLPRTGAVDLPMKALVWHDDAGKTWFGYNNPSWVAARHGVSAALAKTFQAMTAGPLAAQANEATGQIPPHLRSSVVQRDSHAT